MPIGTTLQDCRDMLRNTIGASPSVGQGVNSIPAWNAALQRHQRRLWMDFNWQHLQVNQDVQMLAGQRYYSFTSASVDFTRIYKVSTFYSQHWEEVIYGIGDAQYNFDNSDLDVRNDPILRWQNYQTDQYEVWPIPDSSNQTLRFRCIRTLNPFLADSDRADLDDDLLVYYCAAEILTRLKSADAEAQRALANTHYARLRGRNSKRGTFIGGGGLPASVNYPRMRGGYVASPPVMSPS